MSRNQLADSLTRLSRYCVSHGYEGYSLYDSHTSPVPFHRMGMTASFYTNQVVKRSPINFRPILGIERAPNPKGIGLFLYAVTELFRHDTAIDIGLQTESLKHEAHMLFERLLNCRSKGYTGTSWGYNYPWPKRDVGLVPAYTPSSVVTGFNSRAILNYHRLFPDSRARSALAGAADFILNDIPRTETDDGLCFSYLPIMPDATVNANLLAAEVLAHADQVHETREHEPMIRKVLEFTMNTQNADGSWWYSFNKPGGKPKKQIDFHQGYVLESIHRLCQATALDFEDYRGAVEAGVRFYRDRQFDENGFAYWRLPKKWPVDIHNQSQGIITFARFAFLDAGLLGFARTIARKTIESMQGPDGRFYYQKWPLVTNRVSYMRWNQGWMYVALVQLIKALESAEANPSEATSGQQAPRP